MKKAHHVLILDDDRMFNMINEKIIRTSKFGEQIDVYSDAAEALTYLKKLIAVNVSQFPDVMFIDINMPLMDGWQFLDVVNKFPEDVMEKSNIYLLTSSIDPNDIERARSYKIVSSMISKPLTITILENLIDGVPVSEIQR